MKRSVLPVKPMKTRPLKGRITLKKAPRARKPKSLRKELEALQKQLVIAIYGKDCFTCPQKDLEGKNCHLGHVPWPRSRLSVPAKFSTDYTRIQCYNCNINGGGMGGTATLRLLKEGKDVEIMWAVSESEKGKTFNSKWFLEQIEDYKNRLRILQVFNK